MYKNMVTKMITAVNEIENQLVFQLGKKNKEYDPRGYIMHSNTIMHEMYMYRLK